MMELILSSGHSNTPSSGCGSAPLHHICYFFTITFGKIIPMGFVSLDSAVNYAYIKILVTASQLLFSEQAI